MGVQILAELRAELGDLENVTFCEQKGDQKNPGHLNDIEPVRDTAVAIMWSDKSGNRSAIFSNAFWRVDRDGNVITLKRKMDGKPADQLADVPPGGSTVYIMELPN